MYKNISIILLLIAVFTGCTSKKEVKLDSKCYELPKTGKCKAMFTKYYFDNNEKECKQFIWGGCGGNIPFKTLQECENKCK